MYFDVAGPADQNFSEQDLSALEDQIATEVERDADMSHEFIKLTAIVNRDGRPESMQLDSLDADRLFARVASVLRASPLCKGARVIVRKGGEGSPQREIVL